MSLLSDAELDACREMAEETMPSTCSIYTRTETNTKGSVEITYALAYSGVKCRMMPVNRTNAEEVYGMKITDDTYYILTVPYDQALNPEDRVVYGGGTYEVTRVYAKHNYRTAVRADVTLKG